MIDHLVGRPSPSWKRAQVFLVIVFWLWRIVRGNPDAPRLLWLRRANRKLKQYTPWQIILSTLTGVYAVRNLDKILGLGSPEPLARLYSRSYYRATWISTGLDAGFATAMSIRPKWLRDVCSILFSVYYLVYANEADEKLRRFRAVPTVEMLRTTWEKTSNPYIRLITHFPSVTIHRKILLPRPKSSTYQRPITAYLFFSLPEKQLSRATDLILDFPGGGFVSMNPEHHEERLRMWARKTCRPVLSIDYGKAPEYPYPFAIDEAFDTYRVLVESVGQLIGMSGRKLNIIMSGDSAGATLAVNVIFKILELRSETHVAQSPKNLPMPISLVLNYAALDFNFTSWMSPSHLRVLQSEHSSGALPGLKELAAQKDHLGHVSPLSMVGDKKPGVRGTRRMKRRMSWRDTLIGFTSSNEKDKELDGKSQAPKARSSGGSIRPSRSPGVAVRMARSQTLLSGNDDQGALADADTDSEEDFNTLKEEERPIEARVRHIYPQSGPESVAVRVPRSESAMEKQQQELSAAVAEANTKATQSKSGKGKEKAPIGTRLTMTSRTGYFQDRIVSPSMMRAMAILYIGPHRNPDFATDYHISPILAPSHLLAQFPPLLMQCGEKDPFVDDTVIFAGRVREAKRARKIELDLSLSGRSARFGESLRMSNAESLGSGDSLQTAMMRERDKLAKESEDDWVQMVLFSEWSHGYLQMPTLMQEARSVIDDLAEWIEESFGRYAVEEAKTETPRGRIKENPPSGRTNSPISHAPSRNHFSPFASETETEGEAITFVPKRLRSRHGTLENERSGISSLTQTSRVDHSKRNNSSSSDATLRDDNELLRTPPDERLEPEALLPLLRETGSPPRAGGPAKVGANGKTGHTITETELIRRRRLLDAHIFE